MRDLIERSDCISRQDALDAFGLSEKTRKYGGDHSGYDTRMLYEIQDTLENLPPVQPELKWIPCSVKLPDEGQKCLVCDKGSIGIDTYIGHGNPYNWKWYTRDYEAWMPLPNPYNGGDSE